MNPLTEVIAELGFILAFVDEVIPDFPFSNLNTAEPSPIVGVG